MDSPHTRFGPLQDCALLSPSPVLADRLQRVSSIHQFAVSINPASVAAGAIAEQLLSVPGVLAGDIILQAVKPTLTAGLLYLGARVSANDQVGITFYNPGNLRVISAVFDPVSVAAATCAEQGATVTGVLTTDIIVQVVKPTATAGLGIVGARASASNTVQVNFANTTAAPIDPPSETYSFLVLSQAAIDAAAENWIIVVGRP